METSKNEILELVKETLIKLDNKMKEAHANLNISVVLEEIESLKD